MEERSFLASSLRLCTSCSYLCALCVLCESPLGPFHSRNRSVAEMSSCNVPGSKAE